ncbi:MAG TPA: hypothetical protein PLQ12_07190, partial [Candidatus Defluviicoccus seviourii]|nr:hypothetical protein [Candidatus Defluviicoccus seviourii]
MIEAQLLEVNAGSLGGTRSRRGSGHRRVAFLAVIAILAAIPWNRSFARLFVPLWPRMARCGTRHAGKPRTAPPPHRRSVASATGISQQ